jgi:hypothetical protein
MNSAPIQTSDGDMLKVRCIAVVWSEYRAYRMISDNKIRKSVPISSLGELGFTFTVSGLA